MKRSISPVRSLLAVALAMAAAPVLAQDGPYTQTVFFGDSLPTPVTSARCCRHPSDR